MIESTHTETDIQINDILEQTLGSIPNFQCSEDKNGKLHRERSKYFVENLAKKFRESYKDNGNVKVFSKHCSENRADFKINEYLYDILVCQVKSVDSPKQSKSLFYIKEALWMIESEFAPDTRGALLDFNKLVLGNSQNKLFIGPQNTVNNAYLTTLLPAARKCNGDVYVALITHPKEWKKNNKILLNIWKLDNIWVPLKINVPNNVLED